MLPKLRRKERKVRLKKPGQRLRSAKHLAWVREHYCAVSGDMHEGGYEAHHVKTRGAGGGDEWAICLCAKHHRQLHDMGRQSFAARHGLHLEVMAQAFAFKSPDPAIREASRTMLEAE